MFSTPTALKDNSRVYDLKQRLDWGEPALTIIDVRSRADFNTSRIMGAVSLPMSELVNQAIPQLEFIRDLYVYGSTDEETAEAVALLKQMGYQNVAILTGGLTAWKVAGFPIEGNAAVVA